MAPSAPLGSKNPGNFFFSIEIIAREGRLRTLNFMTIGQTVSAVGELTDIRTDRQTQSGIYYIDFRQEIDESFSCLRFFRLTLVLVDSILMLDEVEKMNRKAKNTC